MGATPPAWAQNCCHVFSTDAFGLTILPPLRMLNNFAYDATPYFYVVKKQHQREAIFPASIAGRYHK